MCGRRPVGGMSPLERKARRWSITSSVNERPLGYLRGLRRIEVQHVGQHAVRVDGGDRLLASVVASVTHQVDELFRPPRAVVDRLAGVVLLLGLVGVEEAADRRVAGAIDVVRAAVLAHAAAAPDADLRAWPPSSLVGSSSTIENTLASVFESTPVHGDWPPRWGAVKFRPPVVSNRFLMPSKSKKNASLRAPAKNV